MMTCKSYVFSAGSYSDNSLFFTVLGNHQNLIFDRMSNIFWFIRFTRQSDFSGIQWIQTKDCSALQMMETDDAQEPIEIVVPGQYYFRNGSHYLRYEEMLDDTAETTVNYIKMSPNGVEVRKQGQVNVHMVFEEGKKNKTFYNTPYGTLQMGISATGLELKESEDGIQMKVDYALDMNEEHVADCYLTVQAQSKDSADFVL